jgi:hypothetical protein
MIGYRIVEIKNGKVMSLFHGTNKSREIKLDQWNTANKKMVRDGSNGEYYLSGWHTLTSREECQKFFMDTFRIKENRYIIKCEVRGDIRLKHKGGRFKPCMLADEILIKKEWVESIL